MKTKIVVGLYDKKFEKPENFDERVDNIRQYFRGRVDAGYGSVADGYWKGSLEKAYVFECVNISEYLVRHESVEDLVKDLREEFEQESIPIIRENADIEFIDGDNSE